MKEKKKLTPDRYESFRVILSFSMCIDVTMQHEEKTVIRDWVQMWRVELYMYRQVYCQVLEHKILIDMNRILSCEILQQHWKPWFLYR